MRGYIRKFESVGAGANPKFDSTYFELYTYNILYTMTPIYTLLLKLVN